jgi:hypothetical protein
MFTYDAAFCCRSNLDGRSFEIAQRFGAFFPVIALWKKNFILKIYIFMLKIFPDHCILKYCTITLFYKESEALMTE